MAPAQPLSCAPGSGHHFPMNDDPDLFAGAVRDFAASTQPRSASQR
jgi:hypothetical protein